MVFPASPLSNGIPKKIGESEGATASLSLEKGLRQGGQI
jgi:hypothetical protein